MPKMSHNKVVAICEIYQNEVILSFSKYNKNKERQGFYSCKKCSIHKTKKTCYQKYGVENYTQTEFMRENNRKWMSSDKFKEKSKESLKEIYGADHYSKTNKFKSMMSELMKNNIKELKENGTYNCFLSHESNKELKEKGMLNKYGHKYSLQVQEIKDKIQNINLEKYGHITPLGNKEIQEKIKDIFIEKYGVDNPFKNKNIQEKIRLKNEERYNSIDKELFSSYKKIVRNLTNKNKKTLFKLNYFGF